MLRIPCVVNVNMSKRQKTIIGVLPFLYCNSYINSNRNRVEKIISQKEFNDSDNINIILPTKFYTYEHTAALLKQNQFEMLDYQVYHNNKGIKWADKILGTDRMVNLNCKIKAKNGRDLYVCAIPK